MEYYIIGDEDAVLGFRLVGVHGRTVTNREQAEEAFREALKNDQLAVIIITERIAELIRPLVDRFIFREKFPLLVEIPDRLGPLAGRSDLRSMVNEAIGITL
jgi:V/A-type H+/Na+-transporting ATPase subunit F